jgi:hypothetical protein
MEISFRMSPNCGIIAAPPIYTEQSEGWKLSARRSLWRKAGPLKSWDLLDCTTSTNNIHNPENIV